MNKKLSVTNYCPVCQSVVELARTEKEVKWGKDKRTIAYVYVCNGCGTKL